MYFHLFFWFKYNLNNEVSLFGLNKITLSKGLKRKKNRKQNNKNIPVSLTVE